MSTMLNQPFKLKSSNWYFTRQFVSLLTDRLPFKTYCTITDLADVPSPDPPSAPLF